MTKKFKVIRKVFFIDDADTIETEFLFTSEEDAQEELRHNYYSDCRRYNLDDSISKWKEIKNSYEVEDLENDVKLEGYIEFIEE